MNFNQLKYIVSVDKHRNFARAADECETAQSTLSKEIQRLEKEFKIMIFDRSRHPVVPTMKGVALIKQAKEILEGYEKFHDTALKMNNLPEGNFRLGILPALAPYLLPLFIQQLSKKYPQLNVQISEISSKEMTEHFESDTLDGAIIIAPFYKEGYYEDPLFEEKFVLYISAEHNLASHAVVDWHDIPLYELILHEDFKEYLLASGQKKNKPLIKVNKLKNITYQSGSLETIRKIIDRNGGLTLLPQLACLYMGPRRLKMVRSIASPTLSRTISFVTPRGFQKNRITKVIKKEILAHLPKELVDR